MQTTVKVADAKTHLSELIVRVQAGEEIVISRGNIPVARLVPLDAEERRLAVIEEVLAMRDSPTRKPVTQAEIQTWKHEGHKY